MVAGRYNRRLPRVQREPVLQVLHAEVTRSPAAARTGRGDHDQREHDAAGQDAISGRVEGGTRLPVP
jgi:hypothetical protein